MKVSDGGDNLILITTGTEQIAMDKDEFTDLLDWIAEHKPEWL
jgi:hypothetical protein